MFFDQSDEYGTWVPTDFYDRFGRKDVAKAARLIAQLSIDLRKLMKPGTKGELRVDWGGNPNLEEEQ